MHVSFLRQDYNHYIDEILNAEANREAFEGALKQYEEEGIKI